MEKKLKLRIVFKGGGSMIVKCKSFTMDRLTNSKSDDRSRELSITDPDRVWTVDVDEIVGFTAKKVWF